MAISTISNLEVLYEDNHIIAVNKKSSDIVQGDKTGDLPLNEIIKSYLKKKYGKPGEAFLGTVHRIDRPVSGVVIFAKTSKSLARLNKMFQNKEVKKTYLAVVKGFPKLEKNHLTHYLVKDTKKNKSFTSNKVNGNAKRSELKYVVKHKFDNYTLLEVTPLTGRHHQIRAQLSAIGLPIKGDLKYGFNRSNADASIHLHARKVNFTHPVKKETVEIIAPLNLKDSIWKEASRVLKD